MQDVGSVGSLKSSRCESEDARGVDPSCMLDIAEHRDSLLLRGRFGGSRSVTGGSGGVAVDCFVPGVRSVSGKVEVHAVSGRKRRRSGVSGRRE